MLVKDPVQYAARLVFPERGSPPRSQLEFTSEYNPGIGAALRPGTVRSAASDPFLFRFIYVDIAARSRVPAQTWSGILMGLVFIALREWKPDATVTAYALARLGPVLDAFQFATIKKVVELLQTEGALSREGKVNPRELNHKTFQVCFVHVREPGAPVWASGPLTLARFCERAQNRLRALSWPNGPSTASFQPNPCPIFRNHWSTLSRCLEIAPSLLLI